MKTGLKAKKKAPRRSRSQSVASINAREAEADAKTRVSLGRAQTMYEMESDTGPAAGIQRDRRHVLHKHVALAVLQRRTGGVWRRITSVDVEGAIFQKLVR